MIVIFDLEATCWDKKNPQLISEIIEIGAVKVDLKNNEIIDRFQIFIRPIMNPILSDFCKQLTHINQYDVDYGETLSSALLNFNEFVEDCKLMSWGYYDKKQIERECFLKKLDSPILNKLNKPDNHISLKHRFGDVFMVKPPGVGKALKMLNLQFEGTPHRGIDDAHNIAKILFTVKNRI